MMLDTNLQIRAPQAPSTLLRCAKGATIVEFTLAAALIATAAGAATSSRFLQIKDDDCGPRQTRCVSPKAAASDREVHHARRTVLRPAGRQPI